MPAIYWLILSAILIGIEMITLGLTTIWFAGGALLATLLSYLGVGLVGQVLSFLLVSVLLLVLTRPFALKFLNNRTIKTNADSLIGEIGIVREPIDNVSAKGSVMIRGEEWTARSTSDEILIGKGEKVEIKEISGVKLIVDKII